MTKLNDKQIQAIEMLASGEWKKSEIAKVVGVDRTTLYNWIDKEEFKAELNKRLQEYKTEAGKRFASRLPEAIEKFWKLTGDDVEVRTRAKVLSEWISRCIGNVPSAISIEGNQDESTVDALALFNKIVAKNNNNNTDSQED